MSLQTTKVPQRIELFNKLRKTNYCTLLALALAFFATFFSFLFTSLITPFMSFNTGHF